jgi:hypothetical protein
VCEAELAALLAAHLKNNTLPDPAVLRAHFAPDPAQLPEVRVTLGSLSVYETLTEGYLGEAA